MKKLIKSLIFTGILFIILVLLASLITSWVYLVNKRKLIEALSAFITIGSLYGGLYYHYLYEEK